MNELHPFSLGVVHRDETARREHDHAARHRRDIRRARRAARDVRTTR